eukprot:g3972.t1
MHRRPLQYVWIVGSAFLLTMIVAATRVHGNAISVHEDEDDEDKNTTGHRKPFAFLIVTVFILFGMLGEKSLELIEEHTPEDLKPIQEAMLTEMTLMGVIGIVTFVLGKFKALQTPSEHVLGESDALNEMLEKIHMLLFFILIVFLGEALFLIVISKTHVSRWRKWNHIAIERELLEDLIKTEAKKKIKSNKMNREKLMFLGLRQRFVHDATDSIKLPDDFEFDRYLSQSTGNTIARLVKVDMINWFGLYLLFAGFWVLQWWMSHSVYIVIVSSCPLFVTLVQLVVLLKMRRILDAASPSNYVRAVDSAARTISSRGSRRRSTQTAIRDAMHDLEKNADLSDFDDLSSPLVLDGGTKEEDDVIPTDAAETIPDPKYFKPNYEHEPLFGCFGSYKKAADHTELFWFHDENSTRGQDFLREIIRMSLLIMAVFAAYCISIFVPHTLFGSHHHVSSELRVVSLILLVLPSFIFLYFVPEFVLTFVTITSIEKLKQKSLAVRVKRSMATEKAVRALHCLRRLIHLQNKKRLSTARRKPSLGSDSPRSSSCQKWLKKNRRILRQMFDGFDEDKSGHITDNELGRLLRKHNLIPEEEGESIEEAIREIDEDGSGDVSFNEFAIWVASSHYETEDISECVGSLFKMIDVNGDGFISPSELRSSLMTHSKELTEDDISALITEVDRDGDGKINQHEFKSMMKTYSRLY